MDEPTRQLQAAREREAATREILRVISRSPGDYGPVFQTILDNAIRLCGAPFGTLFLVRGEILEVVADTGLGPELTEFFRANPHRLDRPESLIARTVHEQKPQQRTDSDEEIYRSNNPLRIAARELSGIRTLLGVPIIIGEEAIGVIALWRKEVKPFADDHIELVCTFADQAAIAIENVRQFQALQERTKELTKSLERQTATSEILHVISQSPTDYTPVFQTVLDNATRLCGAPFAVLYLIRDDHLHMVAHKGARPELVEYLSSNPRSLKNDFAPGGLVERLLSGREPVQTEDLRDGYASLRGSTAARLGDVRTLLFVPMLSGNEVSGVIGLYRQEVKLFTKDEIELVRTFANQAVIAIENVRLFNETKEALEQQRASGEVLSVVSNSIADAHPVFKKIIESCERLFPGTRVGLNVIGEDGLVYSGAIGNFPGAETFKNENFPHPASDESATGAAIKSGQVLNYADAMNDPDVPEYGRRGAEKVGFRSTLMAPLLSEGRGLGALFAGRPVFHPFTDKESALFGTFADQAVIAIQNARLFQALESRTTDLTKSLERQTATSDILRAISRSPRDYDPIFATILDNAMRLCEAPLGTLFLLQEGGLKGVKTLGGTPEFLEFLDTTSWPVDGNTVVGRSAVEKASVQVADISANSDVQNRSRQRAASVELEGIRTLLSVPLLKSGEVIGAITLYRREVNLFEDDQVRLIETFADQAVIAIENVRLFQALETRTTDLTQSLERQTATSEILRSISQSPTDYTPVFETILENAVRLCGAPFGVLHLLRDEHLHLVADVGARTEYVEQMRAQPLALNNPVAATSRAARERVPAQLTDVREEARRSGDPVLIRSAEVGGIRTVCAVPMLKGNETVGVLALYREEVRAFEANDLELVSTFADQAVIAIENVRLFRALQSRNAELGESLERQTATSEILRAISRSPTDFEPVFDTILENATRLCDAPLGQLYLIRDGGIHLVANRGSRPEFLQFSRDNVRPVNRTSGSIAKALSERKPVQIEDGSQGTLYRDGDKFRVAMVELEGVRSVLIVPLLKGDEGIGIILLYRREVRAFEDRHVSLVETFADQAVIAIENVRLFNETTEALERQTASADILKSISDSPTDIQPVFDAITRNALKLCGGVMSAVFRFDGEQIQFVAQHGWTPQALEAFQRAYPRTPAEDKVIGRALLERRVVNVADVLAEFRTVIGQAEMEHRSVLVVPLLREGIAIGAITVGRKVPGLFLDKQIDLVATFADQAVIAIENVRLFQALEERTTDLTKTLERQTATSEILRSISQSPTDYTPVFDTILDSATRLCGAPSGTLFLLHGDHLHMVADAGSQPEYVEQLRSNPHPLDHPVSLIARTARARAPIHIENFLGEANDSGDAVRIATVKIGGIRTAFAVPLLKGGDAIGVIALHRRELKPFASDDIQLVATFADQAVIAIENVRMFQALEGRTTELTKTLERQTATSEILRSISQSPTDYAPVFQTILNNAVRLCGAPFGSLFLLRDNRLHVVADVGGQPEFVAYLRDNPAPVDRPQAVLSRAFKERVPVQRADLMDETYRADDPQRATPVNLGGVRTLLGVPMLKGGQVIGVLALYRQEVKKFADDDIELVSTFADQAVIAIENVRLFQALEGRTTELTKTLERQTATSDILRSISQSPTDYAPVFDTILENATRLCGAPFGMLYLLRDEQLHCVADMGSRPELVEHVRANPLPVKGSSSVIVSAATQRTPVQIADLMEDAYHSGDPRRIASAELGDVRTLLGVPMLKGGEIVGVISLYRQEIEAFVGDDIELVSTFADQAVIAIENVRLFQALEDRTTDLTKTLERQTATSEILRSISRSPTDYAPVFDTILDNATRLCKAPLGLLFLRRNGHLENIASIGAQPAYVEFLATHQVPMDENTAVGQAAQQKKAMQVEDTREASLRDSSSPARIATVELEGARTFLAVPMLRDEQVVGVIAIYRREVRRFDDSMVELLETFADQAVIAIENVRLFQTAESRSSELAQSVAELEALGDIAQAVSSSLDVDTVLDTIVTRAVQLSRADAGAINEFDEATGTLPFRAAPGMEHMLELPAPRLGEGAVGRAAETHAPVQIGDITVPGAYTGRLTDSLSDLRIRALLAVPMMQNDHVLGTLVVARRTPGAFPPEAERLLRALGTQSAIAIRNARLFREIEEKGRELEAANRHKSEFLANMSHELRTPLNAVIGFSEVLGERMFGELNDKQAEYVTDIHDSGRHLLSLINDILDLSKVEAGAMELDLGRFTLAPALDNALTLVRERAERRGIVLQAQLEDDLGEMEGDERKLKQILLNLLSNAIKFTGEGGSVTLEARQDGTHVHIAVRDTGVGISEEDLAVIFEEFKQVGTDYARKVEGTGLGLTLTKRFIEMHGGHITVTSEPGAGSVFTAVLPLRPVEQET